MFITHTRKLRPPSLQTVKNVFLPEILLLLLKSDKSLLKGDKSLLSYILIGQNVVYLI